MDNFNNQQFNNQPNGQFNQNYGFGGGVPQKSKLVTVLLWWFFGCFGVHKFYLGKIGMGILYILTGGLCGIGVIVDGFKLAFGNVTDANNVPLKRDIPDWVMYIGLILLLMGLLGLGGGAAAMVGNIFG